MRKNGREGRDATTTRDSDTTSKLGAIIRGQECGRGRRTERDGHQGRGW